MAKASNEPFGTPKAHYASAAYAPFACHACAHFYFPHLCNHPDVIEDAEAGRGDLRVQSKNRFAIVDPGGCCNYFRPK